MADHCCFCDVRRPVGGTNHLVLNGGSMWIEFCPPCGEKETLHSPDFGTVTVAELYLATSEGRDPQPAPAHLHAPPVEVEVEETFGCLAHAFGPL